MEVQKGEIEVLRAANVPGVFQEITTRK